MKLNWKIATVVLIICVGLVGLYLKNRSTEKSDSKTITSKSEKTFTSKLVDLSFKYPSTSVFTEEDGFKDFNGTGKQVFFKDTTDRQPAFEATTTDFKVTDSIFHDLLPKESILNSSTNFTSHPLGKFSQSKMIRPGMYLVASHYSAEGNTSFPSYLLIEPPTESGLKYISFQLDDGSPSDRVISSDTTVDPQGVESFTEAGIRRIVSLNLTDPTSLIQNQLDQAISIAETFTSRTSALKISTTKPTYTNPSTGLTFEYPSNITVVGDGAAEAPATFSASNVNQFQLDIYVKKVSDFGEEPVPFQLTTTEALAEEAALSKGEYGEEVSKYSPTPQSVLTTQNGIHVKSNYSTGFFETCDVSITKVGTFYRNGYQYSLILAVDDSKIMPDYPKYFAPNDPSTCGSYSWINPDAEHGGREQFDIDIKNRSLSGALRQWYEQFDAIIASIHFTN